jgi:hypothetical protein
VLLFLLWIVMDRKQNIRIKRYARAKKRFYA